MKYQEFKKKQQDEFGKLPMKAAFGDKQFKEMMAEWGLTTSKEDLEKICSIGAGAYCLKKDYHLFLEFGERSVKDEIDDYIAFFNEQRPAYSLNYLTPVQFRMSDAPTTGAL